MRICIVQSWGFQKLDGSNLRIHFLLKELIARGHAVTVLHASEEDAAFTRAAYGCAATAAGVKVSRWVSSTRKMYDYSMFIWKGRRALKRIDCDAVFGISFLNSMVAVAHPTAPKTIMYVDLMSHYYHYEARGSALGYLLYRLGLFLEDRTMARAGRIITITKALRELFDRRHWDKTDIIPDGVDTQVFHPGPDERRAAVEEKYGLKGARVIGYFGAVDPCDGVQFMAQAAPAVLKECPEAKFFIVGRGNFLEEVKRIAAANGSLASFIFTGWVNNSEVPAYMKCADVCVVPNAQDKCIAPLLTFRLLEGMASGVTMLASDLPGIREIADDSSVFFSRPEDTPRFAADLLRALKAPEENKKAMRERAWEAVRKIDWRDVAKADSDVIEKNV